MTTYNCNSSPVRRIKWMPVFLLMAGLGSIGHTSAQQYKPANPGSSLAFKIKNFGFEITGSFNGFGGAIQFDPASETGNSVDISVDAGTVNTDNSMRDDHLRNGDYFDVRNYPRIRFVSTKISPAGKNVFTVSGQLTIKDKTRNLSFPVTASPSGDGYVFKGTFNINRRDFGVGGASTISDNLEVSATILGKKI